MILMPGTSFSWNGLGAAHCCRYEEFRGSLWEEPLLIID